MLIAEAAAGGAAHPASQTSDCEKHRGLLDTPDPMSAAASPNTEKEKKTWILFFFTVLGFRMKILERP